MGAEILHNSLQYNLKSSLWDISLISVFCMCCVVFLGLKLKWFRAQLRFGDSSHYKDTAPVQGVGFKLKTNPEDFQVYRITSEFATMSNQNPPKIKENGFSAKIGTTISAQQNSNLNIIKIKQKSSTTNVANINKTYSKPVEENTSSDETNTQNVRLKPLVDENYVTIAPKHPQETISNHQPDYENHPSTAKPIIKKQTLDKPKSVNFEPQPVEITNPNAKKYSQIITGKSKSKINEHNDDLSHYPTATISKNHARNPLGAQRFTKPVENEDKIKIKIVNETPKKEAKEEEYDNGYFMANNYSNAASIFFGGSAPVAQPRPRKFVEMEEDNISNGSETCA